ncbi:MAG TPA: hypothetical protein VN648_27510 [Candidatus Methylomirabilis sp.]|nr:hypothetical protein [Candidatus Methylomirabilis sp.]
MICCHRPKAREFLPVWQIARTVLILVLLGGSYATTAIAAEETLRNVALYVIPREILFFSVQGGVWTSIRLSSGERLLQSGADGNVAAVVTSERAIGFSAVLNATHEIRVTDDETLENFKVEGNVVTLLTKRRAIGFSADTGKWADVDRFQPGR